MLEILVVNAYTSPMKSNVNAINDWFYTQVKHVAVTLCQAEREDTEEQEGKKQAGSHGSR